MNFVRFYQLNTPIWVFVFSLGFFIGTPLTAQNPLAIPDTINSQTIHLKLQTGKVKFLAGDSTNTFGANGNFLGPTLILHRNRHVNMEVENRLPDTTTIHWHGLHVDPKSDGGPHIVIPPGTTWKPSFTVKDWAATYWYHPHMHMRTNEHAMKGIAGLIIVRDSLESALQLPRTYGVDDIPLVVQTRSFNANNQIVIDDAYDSIVMVNGTIKAYDSIPAQLVRFRLLNGSSERVYNFGFTDNISFKQIASDGGLLTAPVTLTRLSLAPGERGEIVVDLSSFENQTVYLKSFASELPNAVYGAKQPGMGPGQTIPGYTSNALNGSDFTVLEIRVSQPTQNKVTSIPSQLVQHTIWSAASADTTRPFVFMPANMGPGAIQGPFMINNAHFNMMVMNEYVPFDNIEIWELRNQSPIAHPFHIHNVHFYVLTINGAAPALNLQGRKDVILVPAGNSVVRFITKFEDYHNDTFPYMYHCHMLTHEDHGMMGQFIVKSPPSNNVHSFLPQGFKVYPNPAMEVLNVVIPEHLSAELLLYTADGKQMKSQKAVAGKTRIATGDLLPGTYLLRVISDQEIYSTMVVLGGK